MFGRVIQPEPVLLRHAADGNHGKSLVIPLGKTRALRIGFNIRAWCKIGPRRYKLVATQQFIESFTKLTGCSEEEVKERLREENIAIQGELKEVD